MRQTRRRIARWARRSGHLLQIWLLKRRARAVLERLNVLYDRYDCGPHLIDEITGGRATALQSEFTETMERLGRLDPTAPRGSEG